MKAKDSGGHLPERDKGCPFCPGNEDMLPEILFQMKADKKSGDAWQTRVVPNKFAALSPDGSIDRHTEGLYVFMEGYGHHEVVIESPYHNRDMSRMSSPEIESVIETYHRRYIDLMRTHRNMMTLIFRNHGARAGTSLIHPHSQILVTGMVPNHIRWREDEAQRYFDEWGRCVYCDILDQELGDGRRIVAENKRFVAFVPFAAEVPYETWILPREHKADFGSVSDEEKSYLSAILRDILSKLHETLDNPAYNFIVNTAARFKANEPQLHWYLQIRPRLTTPAGFEIGSGICINPSLPEEDAKALRSPPSPSESKGI
jgi:UDPglucose--hexose-1-phosphate uridylyltransferase